MRSQSFSAAWSPLPARASWPSSSASSSSGVRRVVVLHRQRFSAERLVRLLERRQARALRRHLPLALEVALELGLGRAVLLRPLDLGVADARRFEQRPGRVGEMRPGDGAQVGAAGGDDAVDVVGLGDRAHRDGRDAGLVADAVGERRLVHAAVDRLLPLAHLARRAVDQVGAGGLEGARDLDRVVRRDAALDPVVRRDAHRDRQLLRPDLAHRLEHLERIAQPVRQRAAVLVGALVGERRDEGRQQVAVRAVQLEPVEAGLGGVAGGADEVVAHAVHVGARHRLATSRWCRRGTAAARPRSAASCRVRAAGPRPPRARGSSPWRRRGRAASRSWRRCWRARSRRCASRRRAAPSFHRPGQPGVMRASGEGQVISATTSAGAAHRPRAEVHQVVVAGHAVDRASTAPSARRRRGSSASCRAP